MTTIELKWTRQQPTRQGWYFIKYRRFAAYGPSPVAYATTPRLLYVRKIRHHGWNTDLVFAGPFRLG